MDMFLSLNASEYFMPHNNEIVNIQHNLVLKQI